MNRRSAVSLLMFLLAFPLLACGDSSGPKQSIDGTWTGVAQGGTFTVTLTEGANNTVTGNGTAAGAGGAIALTVTGTFDNSDFSLTLASPGFQSINYAGELDDDTLDGVMNGSGFVNEPLIMARQ